MAAARKALTCLHLLICLHFVLDVSFAAAFARNRDKMNRRWARNGGDLDTDVSCDVGYTRCDNETQSKCVKKCDDIFHCDGCSDEIGCEEDPRFPRIFVCKDNSACTFIGDRCNGDLECVRFCDGVAVCKDESDEPYSGLGFKCPVNSRGGMKQKDERCVIPAHMIDRWQDVKNISMYRENIICPREEDVCYIDGSPYLNASKCHQCLDGTVISMTQTCDGIIDCADMSDECLCFHEQNPAQQELYSFCQLQFNNTRPGKILCSARASKKQYINGSDLCNNQEDCQNGIDERFCGSGKDNKTTLTCPNSHGQRGVMCDGRPECVDSEVHDECNGCPDPPGFCDFFFFGTDFEQCEPLHYDQLLSTVKLCDGVWDCENGTDEAYCPTRELCDPEHPESGSYDKERDRCNFVFDCPHTRKDEQNCSGQFMCDNGKIISRAQVLDGIIDCPSGKDECVEDQGGVSERQLMIRHGFLVALMWLMAAVALVGNTVVIVNSARDLRATYRRGATAAITGRVGACNKTLVLNLALADFLMGVYLLILNIKAAQYSGSYCRYSTEWRSSSLCSALGAIAVLSSQTSVVIMVMMTTYRLYSVRMPFRAEKLKVRYLVALVIAGWIPPALVAFYPLVGYDKSFAFTLTSKMTYFNATVEKPEFEDFIRKAWAFSNFSGSPFVENDWSSLMEKYCKMYPKFCGSLEENPLVDSWLGYYSADSVCLPRLFPHVGDSGWIYTAAVIGFDFGAFLYILTAYSMMYLSTVTGLYQSGNGTLSFRGSSFSSVDELRSREDKVIWQRISRLLVTDFICWIPICATCLVSLTSGIEIPPLLYQLSAIVFLPVNSALNPLLYSNIIYRAKDRFCNRGVYAKLWERFRANGTHTPTDAMNLNGVAAASASENLKLSADQLAITETRSITLSETDRSRAGVSPESKHVISPGRVSINHDETVFDSGSPTEERTGITKFMPKMGRFFSEKNNNGVPSVRYHRAKSQSTTSTSTTFTTIAPNE